MTNVFLFLIFFGLFFWIVGSIIIRTLRNGISPMPTSGKTKRALLQLLPKDLRGTVYELGSGWGTLAIPLAKKLPACHVIGMESSPFPFRVSKLRYRYCKLPNLTLLRQDFFKTSLKDASLVVCYLYPGAMKALEEKFEKELRPGTWVISHTFAIPNWTPFQVIEVPDLYKTKIYLYSVGFKKKI